MSRNIPETKFSLATPLALQDVIKARLQGIDWRTLVNHNAKRLHEIFQTTKKNSHRLLSSQFCLIQYVYVGRPCYVACSCRVALFERTATRTPLMWLVAQKCQQCAWLLTGDCQKKHLPLETLAHAHLASIRFMKVCRESVTLTSIACPCLCYPLGLAHPWVHTRDEWSAGNFKSNKNKSHCANRVASITRVGVVLQFGKTALNAQTRRQGPITAEKVRSKSSLYPNCFWWHLYLVSGQSPVNNDLKRWCDFLKNFIVTFKDETEL